jgi:hypothetical protein
MPSKRTEIREALKSVLGAAVSYPVYAGRSIDGRDEIEFANVYLTAGDSAYEGLRQNREDLLVVAYRTAEDLDDDAIDQKSEVLETAMVPQIIGGGIHGLIYTGYEYVDADERGFSGIDLKYTVFY